MSLLRDRLERMMRERGLDPDKLLKTAAQIELEQELADPRGIIIDAEFRRVDDSELLQLGKPS